MSEAGAFRLEQLMELAGLAVACAVSECYPPRARVLCLCGPGNQGGDGLVAARHLAHFGFRPSIFWPKRGKNAFYAALKRQCDNVRVPEVVDLASALDETDVVLDAIFGFSFSPEGPGGVRPPFDRVIDALRATSKPIISVDIPSSWDVERGNVDNAFTPAVLISLTAPKLGARDFRGRHLLGGRFVPTSIAERFDLRLPPYTGAAQLVDITGCEPVV